MGAAVGTTEFLLALHLALADLPNVSALACDTDGIDGVEDNAGAWFDHGKVTCRASALKASSFLSNNDA
jgi:glycerate 2-kinase